MKINYRTTTEIWGNFEAEEIEVREVERGIVSIYGADTKEQLRQSKFIHYVGDVVAYTITK